MKNRIKTRALNAVAFVIYAKEEYQLLRQAEKHEAMIAESQAKIGPYKPASIPVQIWA